MSFVVRHFDVTICLCWMIIYERSVVEGGADESSLDKERLQDVKFAVEVGGNS
jgi:hypothetical protein